MYTIGKLAREFDLSRSTLLYYDRIGLLSSSLRTESDYRLYSQEDARRLEQIRTYRRAGLSLADIRRVLDAPGNTLTRVLEKRLDELNEDIRRLRDQQRLIVGLLRNEGLPARIGVMNKQTWVSLLRASGFDEEDMARWHEEFERLAPKKHEEFLRFLCIPDEEIRLIRTSGRSRKKTDRL